MEIENPTSKIPLPKRLVKRITEDWSEVSKDVVMRKANWKSFSRWLRLWQELLTDIELRVALFVANRTIGFGKKEDKISFKQFRDGVEKKDGKIICLGSGAKDKVAIREALKNLEEISFLEINRTSGTLPKYRLITQKTLSVSPTPPCRFDHPPPVGLAYRVSPQKPAVDITIRDITRENLREEFIKERGEPPFDEVQLNVFKSEKAYRAMR